jgi:hypothetical protein
MAQMVVVIGFQWPGSTSLDLGSSTIAREDIHWGELPYGLHSMA